MLSVPFTATLTVSTQICLSLVLRDGLVPHTFQTTTHELPGITLTALIWNGYHRRENEEKQNKTLKS